MAAAAVRLTLRIFPTLSDRRVLFVGAGDMIELCATHFAGQSPQQLTVANRTLERAEQLAKRFAGDALELRLLPEYLARYDVVVSCTASSLPIIGKGLMERVVKQRRREPVVMVDLAVPRDIEPEVAKLHDVFLYTVDDLGEMVKTGAQERQSAVGHAEAIIETQVGQFLQWMQSRNAVPLIRDLRDQAEAARQGEVDRALKKLARGDDPGAVMEALSRGLTAKLMHAPTQAFAEAASTDDVALQQTLARLFKLRNER